MADALSWHSHEGESIKCGIDAFFVCYINASQFSNATPDHLFCCDSCSCSSTALMITESRKTCTTQTTTGLQCTSREAASISQTSHQTAAISCRPRNATTMPATKYLRLSELIRDSSIKFNTIRLRDVHKTLECITVIST